MRVRETRVLVTGGAGFIGSHLVDRLLALSNEVIVVDDFSSGSEANLEHCLDNPALKIVRADVRSEHDIRPHFHAVDYVFHLATRNVRLSLRQPTQVHEVNATGTLNVLKSSVAAGVSRFLYCSSSEVNGSADIVPMPEDYHFKPETIYGASKLAGEYYTQVFWRSGWLSTVIARPHNNYGPREHYSGHLGEVIPRFVLRALAGLPPVIFGDGSHTRDFTYVTDTVHLLIKLMETDAAAGRTVNVCRGEEVSIRDLALLVLKLVGLEKAPLIEPGRPSDVRRLFGSNDTLRALVGETPATALHTGLAQTIEWFRGNVARTQELLDDLGRRHWDSTPAEPWLEGPARPGGRP